MLNLKNIANRSINNFRSLITEKTRSRNLNTEIKQKIENCNQSILSVVSILHQNIRIEMVHRHSVYVSQIGLITC